MVCVSSAEATENDSPMVCLAVTIGIGQMEKICAVAKIDTIVSQRDPLGYMQVVGKHLGFVRTSIAIGVFQNDDLVVGRFVWLDVWVQRSGKDV